MVFLYVFINHLTAGLLGYFFWISFSLPLIIKILALLLFVYIIYPFCEIFIAFVFALFKKERILPEIEDIAKNGIPEGTNVAMFRPIFAKTNQEMENLLQSMEKDIQNNIEDAKSLKFIVIDNTRDAGVKEYVCRRIKELQQKYGEGTVFYFHRNVECDFFKKLGIYEDAILFLHEGATRPSHYTGKRWEKFAGGTRNPNKPLWDIILGNIKELGIRAEISEVLEGKDIEVDKDKRIKVAFVSDADNVWPKNGIRKMVAKILNPENKNFVIYQPRIEVQPPFKNLYTKISVIKREITGFLPKMRWRIFNFSPFYGKGAMEVSGYIEKVIKAEALHPAKAASHDFQETLFANCCLVEGCVILEGIFSNKISEIKRVSQWRWGDMETVKQFLFRKFSSGRKKHLFVLLRGLIEPIICDLFILLLLLGVLFFDLQVVNKNFFYVISALIIFPYLIKPKWLLVLFVSIFLIAVDLTYMPLATLRNYFLQMKGKKFVWKTGAMGEMETRDMTIFNTYWALKEVILWAVLFLLISYFWKYFLIPATILLIAPAVTWIISREK